MADIQAFRALRYDLSRVGNLSDVIAPPYDVIDGEFQQQLYDKHDNNIVRLILNAHQDGDEELSRYQRAAKHLKNWRREGIVQQDIEGAIYVYHQTFTYEGQEITRRGFLSRVRLEKFGEGNIYPHEETHSKAKKDRLNLTTHCNANLSPIFSIFSDKSNEVQEVLEAAISDSTPIVAVDHLGVKHSMWLVTDTNACARAAELMGPKDLYIADGHHRYETALNFQKQKSAEGELAADDPANYVLMMNVSMDDAGMIVLPTHRLFRGIDPIKSAELIDKVSSCFDCTVAGQGPAKANELWEEIAVEDNQAHIAMYCAADDTWVMCKLTDAGATIMKDLIGQSDEWRSLGVAILHKLLVGHLLGYNELGSPLYVHEVEEVIHGLTHGDATGRDATGQEAAGEQFQLGCLVMPATLGHVRDVSLNGERMPAKSTYFYPKLLSGLVINPLSN
jgi:uncharacterized protein (DUF1015 family)